MRVKKILLRLSASVIGIVVALGGSELALRLARFEFNLYPSAVQFGWPDPVTIKRIYQSDRDLLWVPKDYGKRIERALVSPPALIFSGCSCTEFGRYDAYFTQIMATEFPDSGFTFLNLGVGGWSSYQGLRQMERDIVRIKPRVVTIFFGWNDHWNTFGIEDKFIGKYHLDYPEIVLQLKSRSRIAQLINKVLFDREIRGKTASKRVSPEDFKSNLKDMVRVAREHAIRPVLLTAPSGHTINPSPLKADSASRSNREGDHHQMMWLDPQTDLVNLHETYVQVVRNVADDEEVDVIDLHLLFRDLPGGTLPKYFKVDGIHLREDGNRLIAQFLYDYFKQTSILQELLSRDSSL